jgi:hypothetical protein
MISEAFKQLKERSGAVELARVRHLLGFKVSTHKRKRLDQAVGQRVGKRTILDSDTHTQHQNKLFTRFQKAWERLPEQQARERLRFVTILDTVCAVETKAILHAVERMEEQLRITLSAEIEQIGILGVSEVEIVNLGLYGKEGADDEARKGQVLRDLARKTGMKGAGTVYTKMTGEEHLAFVHFHGIIDLGPQAAIMEKKLEVALRKAWQGSRCIELKRLFTDLSIKKSLWHIAGYLTKGGNKDLRYQKQFGSESMEAFELSMAKRGHPECGEKDDHLGLSIGEVSVLIHVYDALMRRNSTSDGYLFLGGAVVRNRYQPRHGYRIWKSAVRVRPFWKSTIAISSRRVG